MTAGWRSLALALALTACRAGSAPDLGGLYNRAAEYDDMTRNPVIVIPGVLGSKLIDETSGQTVWGAFGGESADPETPEGARLIALPMASGEPLSALRDGVIPDGVLDSVRIRLLGVPLESQAYVYILKTLGVGGYRDEDLKRGGSVVYRAGHFTCFQFSYDWRRDNAENARRLHAFIAEKRAYVQSELWRRYGVRRDDLKFDVIAHSMGGLLLRYYLEYGDQPLPEDGSLPEVTWAGARDVSRAVLVATPNAGSAEALTNLVEGVRFSWLLPRYDAALIGTFPSLYQLLPRARHRALRADDGSVLDPLDVRTWERFGWGLASPGADAALAELLPDVPDPAQRRWIAREHLAKSLARARQLHAALDRPAKPPAGLTLHLFAGDAEPTAAVLTADAAGKLRVSETAPGDGTVLRTSAIMDERQTGNWQPGVVSPIAWTEVTFLFADHLALTRDPAFTDNILYRLLESPRAPADGPLSSSLSPAAPP
jgi:lecithin:cholesterol acyltransferase